MAVYSAWKNKQNQLIRKAKQGSAFIAPEAQAIPATLTTGAGAALISLPVGWEDIGWTSTDGVSFGRAVDNSDVTSWGSVEPTRRDIVRDTATITVVAQETSKTTIELYTGATLADALVTTGEVVVSKPAQPATKFNRLMVVAVDENTDGEIYIVRLFPRVSVTDYTEQKFAEGDDPITYGVTFTAYNDSVAGYSERTYFGGPGWLALLADMGIDQAS